MVGQHCLQLFLLPMFLLGFHPIDLHWVWFSEALAAVVVTKNIQVKGNQ